MDVLHIGLPFPVPAVASDGLLCKLSPTARDTKTFHGHLTTIFETINW